MLQHETELLLPSVADPTTACGRDGNQRLLVLAAHPDDETIGASQMLGGLPGATVVYLTDGAPREVKFRSPHFSGSRELYASVRAEEAVAALAQVQLSPQQILFLSASDQEAIFHVGELVYELLGVVEEFRPSIIVTHAYEGGHPDHDTAALVARLTVELTPRRDLPRPELVEMTSYHALRGKLVTGEFLATSPLTSGNIRGGVLLNMSAAERMRKARMLACYVSQSHVLSAIPLEPERLRRAPVYDFTQPCHPGALWYEVLGWPLTGWRWRQLAGQALAQYGELACR